LDRPSLLLVLGLLNDEIKTQTLGGSRALKSETVIFPRLNLVLEASVVFRAPKNLKQRQLIRGQICSSENSGE
jgi:hypothetical protein